MSKVTPAFIGIGSSYSGLGKIAEWFTQHPDVADHIPALNFFNTDAYAKHGHAWYETRLQETGKPGAICGECSPGYLSSPEAATRIARDYPRAKLFVVVRHPVYRALAEYDALRSVDEGARTMSATEYLARVPKLQTQGFYANLLEPYLEYYSSLQLKVIFYEDLTTSPLQVIQDLYEYIGIDRNFAPKELKMFAPQPEESKHPGLIKRGIRGLKRLYKRVTTKPAKPVFTPNTHYESLLSEAERTLFTEAFLPSVDRLSRIVDKDVATYWQMRG